MPVFLSIKAKLATRFVFCITSFGKLIFSFCFDMVYAHTLAFIHDKISTFSNAIGLKAELSFSVLMKII